MSPGHLDISVLSLTLAKGPLLVPPSTSLHSQYSRYLLLGTAIITNNLFHFPVAAVRNNGIWPNTADNNVDAVLSRTKEWVTIPASQKRFPITSSELPKKRGTHTIFLEHSGMPTPPRDA